jgi:hypothetical protein
VIASPRVLHVRIDPFRLSKTEMALAMTWLASQIARLWGTSQRQ